MNRETSATFIGHRDCYGLKLEVVCREVEGLVKRGVTDFLCGEMGAFDYLCASAVYKLKVAYPHIKCHAVIPYLTRKVVTKQLFDSIIYPEGLEKYHFKAAIPARNKWMVQNSAYALCYVNHDWGGAAKTYERAQKEGLIIVNMGEGF